MGEMERSACRELPESLREEVLARLPLKSLCRSRCVSKEWNELISSARFITTKWAPNRNPHLVVQSWYLESNMLVSMAYCFFTQTWEKIPSISLSSLAQEVGLNEKCSYRHVCYGSSTGLFLLHTENAFVIYNPLTKRSVQRLPPLSYIPGEIGIMRGEGHSQDTYKVVAVAKQCYPFSHESIVQAYNSTDNSWRNVGHLPAAIRRCTERIMRVCYGESYYWLTHGYPGQGDWGIIGFSFRDGTCVTAPLPEKAVDIDKYCKCHYLFVCRSRVLFACCIYDWKEQHLQEVIIWEFNEKEKVDSSSSSSSSWWKEIGRMPQSMCQDLNRSVHCSTLRLMRCEGVGDYACFIFSLYAGAVDVIVYSITERAWSWLPTWRLNEDASGGVIWTGEFEPRPDMMVQ